MKKLMIVLWVFFATITTQAQYDNYSRNYDDNNYQNNRYYYDDNFDWRWDARVRISNGIRNGNLTRREADRLYNRLEDIERREYAYQEDGRYTNWEQDEIWSDVVYLNRRIGVEINDGDRIFYGFSLPGVNFRGFNSWFYQGGYDFNRFDRRGFGNIRMGYNNRNYHPKRQIERGHHNNDRRLYSDNRFDKNRKYDNRNENNNRRGYAENRDERNSNREMPRSGADTRGNERRNMPRIQNNESNPVRTESPRSIDNGGRNREQPQAPTENRNGRASSEDRGMRAESITRPDIEAPRERANGRRSGLE